jgi:hypothetical protein
MEKKEECSFLKKRTKKLLLPEFRCEAQLRNLSPAEREREREREREG